MYLHHSMFGCVCFANIDLEFDAKNRRSENGKDRIGMHSKMVGSNASRCTMEVVARTGSYGVDSRNINSSECECASINQQLEVRTRGATNQERRPASARVGLGGDAPPILTFERG